MDGSRYLVARDLDELSHVLQLIPRGKDCIKRDDSTELQCPKCSDGESCQFTIPFDCTQCATSVCMKDEEAESDKGGGGLNIGGFVGGVVGGIVIITVATYLLWRFYIRPKRSQTPTSIYVEDVDPVQGFEKDAASRGSRPPSTHTVHSIAPTVLTRASNIIQIAYIPGVTNRATPTPQTILFLPSRRSPCITPRATDAKETTTNTFSSLATFKTLPTWAYLATQTEPHTLAPSYPPRSSVTSLPRFCSDH